jgi:hypothetical protein
MSGLVKGVVKRAKKGLKFLKRNWRKIVIAAAIVFTAGIATVGFAGFGAAMGTASAAGASGFGAFMSAAGSTMMAGVASIGGTLGIGKGAALSGFGGTGYATLGTGAAAQGLGLAGSNAAMTAGNLASSAPSALASPAMRAGQAAASAVGPSGAGGGLAGAANAASAANAAGTAGGGLANATGGFLRNNAGTLLQAGMGLVSGYMQGRAQDEEWERTKPRGMWGVGLNGVPSTSPSFAPGLMWNPNSRPGFTGNAALDSGQQIDPNSGEPLNEDYDPTLAHMQRRTRAPIYGG